MEKIIASRMSLGNWSPVRSRWRCSKIHQAWMVCGRSSMLAAFGGDKISLLSSRLLPAANGSYRAASLHHCSNPVSRSAHRTTSRASPSVLEIKKCCSSWSSSVTPNSCWRSVASESLRSSSLVPARVRSSFRTGRALKSSAPPSGRATSYPPYGGE